MRTTRASTPNRSLCVLVTPRPARAGSQPWIECGGGDGMNPTRKRIKAWRSIVRGLALITMLGLATPTAATETLPSEAAAQAPTPAVFELRLKDGSVVYGTVQSETADRVVVRTIAGAILDVERAQIASLEPARGQIVDGAFRPADANATRLLFSPTARSLRKGEGYIGVYDFLLPFVQVGITDRLSMGVGTPLIFFGDESGRPVWLTPKYQFYKDPKLSAAVGVLHFVIVGENVRFGLAYTVATIGGDDDALTVGAGWAYARYHENEYIPCLATTPAAAAACPGPQRVTKTPGSPIAMVGGEHRVSRRVKLLTENYAFKRGAILSAGVRFLGERLSADLGVFAPVTNEDTFVLAPIVNFVWAFGK